MTVQTAKQNSKTPMYAKVHRGVRQQIVAGELDKGQKIPSVEQLCAKYDVSAITVRRAMELLVEEGLVERIPGSGTFVKNSVSQNKMSEAGMVSLVVANLYGEFPGSIVAGVEAILSEAGYKVGLYISNNSYKRERENLERILEEGTAGVIIFGVCLETVNPNCDILLEVKRRGIPLVMVDTYLPSLDIDHVVSDDYKGSYELTQHFIKLGHRDIGYIRVPEDVTSIQARFAGYQAAMADNDLPVKSKYVFSADVLSGRQDFCSKKGYGALVDYMSGLGDDLPSAFLCYKDGIAINVYRALLELGIDVPGKVAIGGFGGDSEPALFQIPLTTVLQPKYELGEKAAEIILDRIANPCSKQSCQHVSLPTKLLIRNSCGNEEAQRI